MMTSRIRTRAADRKTLNDSNEMRRRVRQKELMQSRIEEALEKYVSEGPVSPVNTAAKKNIVESYRNESYIPKDLGQRIYVDRKNDTLLLPINGFAVPIHFSNIKTISKTDEGEFSFIRINFNVLSRASIPERLLAQTDSNILAIKSVTFKATDLLHSQEIVKSVNEFRKELISRYILSCLIIETWRPRFENLYLTNCLKLAVTLFLMVVSLKEQRVGGCLC